MRIAICDDEKCYLAEEKSLIQKILNEKHLGYSIDLFEEAKTFITAAEKYDIVFLDVEMGGMNGISAAEQIHENNKDCLIFFVTNYGEYLDEALNKHAFRFWTKPMNPQRLSYGIDSAVNEISRRDKSITIGVNNELMTVNLNDIIFVYAKSRNTYIITARGEIVTHETLRTVKAKIASDNFCESHGSYYINLSYVKDFSTTNVMCTCNGQSHTAYMSRRMYSHFKKRFIAWIGDKR